jgi:DNA-binding IclR family transcriptional regulator
MNSWKLNGIAGHLTRQAIIKKLNINNTEIYKTVKSIDYNGIIETKEGKKYVLVLKKLEDE